MELKTSKWFYILTATAGSFVLILGSWWLFLVLKLGSQIENLHLQGHDQIRLVKMITWEGAAFFAILISFILLIVYFFTQDKKKAISIQAFYASMTHELKTPLASINLEADFILDILESNTNDMAQVKILLNRIKEDCLKLENHLDRSLQLARVESGGNLSISPIKIFKYLSKISCVYPKLNVEIIGDEKIEILADEFALSLIFKNLIENSIFHNSALSKITINIAQVQNSIQVSYTDHGNFKGEINHLGNLFYKYQSPKGSGIGIYLIKKLMISQKGILDIQNNPLTFNLTFQTSAGES